MCNAGNPGGTDTVVGSDRPNPEPVRQKPNRTFGKTWVPPKRFGLEAEPVRPFRRNPREERLRSFPTICSTLSGLFWLSVRHHSREREEGRRTCTPSPILPRLPSSLSPCLDSRPYRPREKTPLSEVCSPFGRSRPRPSRVRRSWPTDNYLGT